MSGIVMDIKGKKAVVYTDDGQMTEIVDHGYKIGEKISVNTHGYIKYTALAASFLICCIAGYSGYNIYHKPESYVYIDINPSIRLDINRFDSVISAIPLNDDAETLLSAHPITEKKTDECINSIIDYCLEEQYINEENNVVDIDVMTDRDTIKNSVNSASEHLKNSSLNVDVKDVSEEESRRAIELKTSPRRLRAIRAFAETFGIDLQDAAKKLYGVSNKEIYHRIEKKKQETGESTSSQNTESSAADTETAFPRQTPLPNTGKRQHPSATRRPLKPKSSASPS